ncbi:hypothetical protein AVEN_76309-1 [Araneus ventricosus]|uniref:MATH domain-containing protein n=1 Tax=Araneus ventricosus TaxID=182803 RepID=A0A4Y2MTT9_ARAVE|nr:hypothetical protein AVEN_76309-1 [Araneus ventricosus]
MRERKKGKQIQSPSFIAEALKGTKWSLWLYPMGNTNEYFVGFYLYREIDCTGPNNVEVSYQLAFLDKDGSILTDRIKSKYNLWKGNYWGFHKYEAREKVFVTDREAFLPEDTLMVQCTVWNKEEKPVKPKHLYARTNFKENRRSFVWRIDKFSILKHDVRNKFKDCLIDFDLVLNKEQGLEKKLVVNINSFHESIKYISFKASIVDSDGKKENCGFHEYFADDLNKVELSTRLFTKKLMENKSQYLPIDVLSLDFEYVSSTKTAFYESSDSGTISPKFANEVVESKNEEYVGKEKYLNTAVLVNNLKFMYNERIFSDTEIRTSKQTFPVHKDSKCQVPCVQEHV